MPPPIAAAIASAARLPSATASTTSRPPFTQSPPAKYFGFAVCPVARSTTTRPSSSSTSAHTLQKLRQRRLPDRRNHQIARQDETPNPESAPAYRPPEHTAQNSSSTARAVRTHPDCNRLPQETARPPASHARTRNRTPTCLSRCADRGCTPLRAQPPRRIRRIDRRIARAHHHHRSRRCE